MNTWESRLEKINTLIAQGQINKAKFQLNQVNIKRIPRSLAHKFAQNFRRVGLSHLSLRCLKSIIRPEKLLDIPPSHDEVAEYSIALVKVGAIDEGIELLSHKNQVQHIQSLLYLGMAYMNCWNYSGAIDPLERFLALEDPRSYWILVAQLNLAASYTNVKDFSNSNRVLTKLISSCKQHNHHRLLGHAYEILAQSQISEKKFNEAEISLEEARKLLSQSSSIFELFIRKWKGFLHAEKIPNSKHKKVILDIKKEAVQRNHWETVRDCDAKISLIYKDHELFEEVYFGTPYKSFKNQILTDYENYFSEKCQLPKSFKRIYIDESGPSFDLGLGVELNQKISKLIKPRQSPYKLFKLLCSDFYKPFRVADIFANIFQNEFYNADSSPDRVYHLVTRLNQWFEDQNIPLMVNNNDGAYHLHGQKPYSLIIPCQTNDQIDSEYTVEVERLKQFCKDQVFTAKKARECLGQSKSTVTKILNWAVEKSILQRKGRGAGIKYEFADLENHLAS